MPTTVQVSENTLQMLNRLKAEMRARSYDQAIRTLVSEKMKIPDTMYGSNPKLSSFSPEDEAELNELQMRHRRVRSGSALQSL